MLYCTFTATSSNVSEPGRYCSVNRPDLPRLPKDIAIPSSTAQSLTARSSTARRSRTIAQVTNLSHWKFAICGITKSHKYDTMSATPPLLVPVWGPRISSPAARTHAAPAIARPSPMQVAIFPLSVPSDRPSREPHFIPAVRRDAARIMLSADR